MKQVTPNLEHIPKRTYIRTGAVIRCYRVLKVSRTIAPIVMSRKFIWKIIMSSESAAKMLMDDLYYGEYTGA